jgi:hypothetical protein
LLRVSWPALECMLCTAVNCVTRLTTPSRASAPSLRDIVACRRSAPPAATTAQQAASAAAAKAEEEQLQRSRMHAGVVYQHIEGSGQEAVQQLTDGFKRQEAQVGASTDTLLGGW